MVGRTGTLGTGVPHDQSGEAYEPALPIWSFPSSLSVIRNRPKGKALTSRGHHRFDACDEIQLAAVVGETIPPGRFPDAPVHP